MGSSNTLSVTIFILFTNICHGANSNLFREYIGAESGSVKLSDVPINPKVEFHFILAFAIDYTNDHKPSPTNGNFHVFWDTKHLNPNHIASTKHRHSNVRIGLSLGGDSVGKGKALFAPRTISSWVQNAVASLTTMIEQYHIDGIDIDYEHFGPRSDPHTFAECIGQLVTRLKNSGTIKFASIAPYEDDGDIERNYKALWRKYGHVIDYVNFQFYAYDRLGVEQFVKRFDEQGSKYGGGQVLASFVSGGGGGLGPGDGFFEACSELLKRGELGGIFVWCADESSAHGFEYEKKSQALLATI